MFVFNDRCLNSPLSGVQRYTKEIAAFLPKDVQVVRPKRRLEGASGHLWEQLILPRLASDRVLFSPGNTGPIAYRKQVVTIHDASTFDIPAAFSGPFGKWYRFLLPRLAQNCLGIITVSNFSKDRLVHHLNVDPGKVHVIHNGITFPRPTFNRSFTRKISLPTKFFLFVGSNEPRKNLKRLIEAFHYLDHPEWHLVIAGGAATRVFSSEELPRSDKVHFLGRVSDDELEILFTQCSAFVFPSLYEGFGLPPLEAMARGCLTAVSRSSSLPEVCGESVEKGGCVVYFDPLSVADMASGLKTLTVISGDGAASLRERSIKHASKFSWEACARQTISSISSFCLQ